MKRIAKRFCAGIMAVVMLVYLVPIPALALSVAEKEDLFRIDSLLCEGGYDENLEWLLDSNNFIYHKQAQIKDQDFWYCVLNAFDVNPVKIAKAFANDDFSSLWSLNGEYKESVKAVILSLAANNNSQETEEILQEEKIEHMYEYVIAAQKYASSTTKYSSLCENFVESSLYQICESYIDGGQKQIEQQIAMRFGDDSHLCEEMFGEFVSSSDYISFIKAGFEYIDYSSELLEIAKYSYDALAELEIYCHQDQQYIDFLRYLYQHSDSYDIVAASGELLTKFTSEYDANYQEAINDIYAKVCESAGEYTLEEVVELITNKLGINSILSGINWGVSAAKLVSNYFFNTSEMIDIIVSIRAYDELSEYISALVKEKNTTFINYFGGYEGKAILANELIYYIELLWQIRRNGENAFFRFRNVLYEAQITSLAYTFGHAADDLASLNQWYGDTMRRFATIYGSLFSEIDSSLYDGLYEYPIEPDKFEIIDKKLIKYNGGDYNIYVPGKVVTIGSGAFTGIDIGTISFEGEIIESNAFSSCPRFYSLYLTKAITTIEDNAFVNCPNLTIYGYRGTYAETYAMANGIPFEARDINWDAEEIYSDFMIENNVLVDYVGDGGDVYIPYGVTHIGRFAFQDCIGLTSVVIPDSVVEIDTYAFRSCNNLKSLIILDGVVTIGSFAFQDCSSLTSVVVPDSVTSIEVGAFQGCNNIESMIVPFVGQSASTNTFLGYVFGDDSYYENGLNVPSSLKTVVLSDVCTKIGNYAFDGCGGLVSIEMPDSVVSIGKYAFTGCRGLTNVSIPNSVTSIGDHAFASCTGLTEMIIPDGITQIGEWAFGGCDNLEDVYITDIVAWCNISFGGSFSNPLECANNLYLNGEIVTDICIPDGAKQIPRYAFSCNSLTNVVIPSSVTSIGDHAFSYCENLKSIIIPKGVNSIMSHAFFGCRNLVSVSIPDSVTSIGFNAFANCFELQNVYITDIGAWCNISFSADAANPMSYANNFYLNGSLVTEINIPNGITSIGRNTFRGFHQLRKVVIPNSVVSIGECAFMGCSNLTYIAIPGSVTQIDEAVFYKCSSLTSIEVDVENANYCSVDGVLFNKNMTQLLCYPKGKGNAAYTIPDRVISIGAWAFYDCSDLTSITLPDGVTSIGDQAFSFCSGLTNIIVPHSVTSIGDSTFRYCTNLVNITLPDGTTKIGENAFAYCWNLTNITIPDSVTSIGSWAFGGCDSLTIICTKGSVAELYAQSQNIPVVYDKIKAISIAELPKELVYPTNGVMNIEGLTLALVFEDNTQTSVTTGYKISEYDFSTEGKKTIIVTYGGLVTDFEVIVCDHTFGEWTIDNPATCTITGSKSRYCLKCEKATEVAEIPASHTYQAVTIDPTCTQDGSVTYTCKVCLDTYSEVLLAAHTWSTEWTVDIEPTETSEGSQSRHCTLCDKKTDITVIPMLSTESPATDFEYSIRNGEVRITGYIGTSGTMNVPAYIENYPVTTIAAFAFSGNATITEATIPYTVTNIEYYAFNNCSELLEVNLDSGITVLPKSLFSRCAKLQKVSLPANLTTIQSNAFYCCESLVEMAIPDTVEVIEDSAFYECFWYANLSEDTIVGTGILLRLNTEFSEDVMIPDGVQTVYACLGENAFTNTYVDQVTLSASITSWNQVDLGVRASSYVVDEGNKYFTSVDGVIYSKDMSTVIAVPSRMVEEISLPEAVTTIGSGAFYASNMSKLTLHNGVTELKEGAFSYCNNLTEITIPNSVISIENNAFRGGNDNLVILCGLGSCAAAYAADNNISFRILTTPKALSITSLPSKLTYPIGGTLDLSGLCLSAVYEDGTTATVSKGYTVSDYDFSTAGTKVITVSLGELSVTFEVVVDPNLVAYPESDHPYANNSNQTWNYTHPSSADQLIVAFSEDTETESGYDKIYIYDGVGNQVGVYSGTQLAGASVTINGNAFSIKLTSDGSVTRNGFTVVSVEAVSSCEHIYSEWTLRTASSCTQTGEEYRLCTACGNEETRNVAALGHTYESVVTQPTCTEQGYTTYTCTVCGDTYTDDRVDALGHTWATEWTVDVEPSETTEGSKSRHCVNCDAITDVTVIPVLDATSAESFNYSINNGTVTITGYIGTEVSVIIPVAIEGYTVTAIGDSAFANCSGLSAVTIPDSITTIGKYAFLNCESLITITIPDSVSTIGDFPFEGCTNLTGIWVDEDNAHFSSDSVGVLFNKDKTALIQAPCAITGSYTVPTDVTSIGGSAFYKCSNMTGVTLPEGLVSIGAWAFGRCFNLTDITLPEDLSGIGEFAFAYCDSLIAINIPVGVTGIGQGTFYDCDNLTEIIIPAGVTSIGDAAFYNCSNMIDVTLPESMTSIGNNTFYSCDNLTDVYYAGTESQWTEVGIGSENESLTSAAIHYNHPDHDYSANPTTCGICGHVRVSLGISSVVLRPTCAGLYFKGTFNFVDDAEVARHGIAVSLYNQLPVADDTDPTSLYTADQNSVLISNILDGGNDDVQNGRALIYARPYVLLEDGTYIYGDVVVTNLQTVVETIDSQSYENLGSSAIAALNTMYQSFLATMQDWLIPNIKSYAAEQ